MEHFITKLFNLKPSDIEGAEILSINGETVIAITLKQKLTPCPHCGSPSKIVHDYYQCSVKHPLLTDRNISLLYNKRRYFCPICKKPFVEVNPFVLPGKRISHNTVIRIMELLKNPSITFSMAAQLTGISHTTAIRIFDTHAGISTLPFPTILCVDEVYTNKYKQKVYSCVLLDFQTGNLYDLLPNRKKTTLSSYFASYDIKVRKKVKFVCIDMWDTYRDISQTFFPNALVCIDSFHVINTINRAFDKVRIRIMNSYDTKSEEYRLLKRFSWLLRTSCSNINKYEYIDLKRYHKLTGSRHVSIDTLINVLISINPELELSYILKEEYLHINSTATFENAPDLIDKFLNNIVLYGIPEFKEVYKTFLNWRKEIINSFTCYEGRRISNGPIEGMNSRIKKIKRNGNGYGNFERFRLRCLYTLNNDSSIRN